MIFYYTGTGNSLFAAKKLLKENESLISMANAVNNNEYKYRLEAGEKLGFVFPVYFYTVPKLVETFVEKLEVGKLTEKRNRYMLPNDYR